MKNVNFKRKPLLHDGFDILLNQKMRKYQFTTK